jgi:hypothetical protein
MYNWAVCKQEKLFLVWINNNDITKSSEQTVGVDMCGSKSQILWYDSHEKSVIRFIKSNFLRPKNCNFSCRKFEEK